ncbi:hypothetical protein [Verrucomicrobium sp. BvORR106]|uniref:hypothetical protein n=1 Tax=Verrucomicrobium sp. BvORR106 TaxID=1403819 RepID=UPI0005702685|nr:hypothetical protein [Verrucomicrobium sp. BvORR106]
MSPQSFTTLKCLLASLGLAFAPALVAEDAKASASPTTDRTGVASLKKDLAGEWLSLSVLCQADCSCTGAVAFGFTVTRNGAGFNLTPTREHLSRVKKGKVQSITPEEIARLTEAALAHYLMAVTSIDPMEKAGPQPKDKTLQRLWLQAYLAAGGDLMRDRVGMRISIKTASGSREYLDWFAKGAERELNQWLGKYGEGPDTL